MFPKIHAVIFDLDGTLANSEPVYRESERWLAQHFHVAFSAESSSNFIGLSAKEYMKWFRSQYHIELSVAELCDLQNRLFLEKGLKKVRPFTATVNFLKFLHVNQIKTGLASGSETKIIQAVIQHLHLERYFQTILSSCELERGKPEPDVFLECAKKLGVVPESCLVLEDSVPGLEAAQAAGMPVITINSLPDTNAKRLAKLRQADLFFASMDEFCSLQILQHFDIRPTL